MAVSPLDTYAAVVRDLGKRIASLERAIGRISGAEPIDWTEGFPTYDLRYVDIAGDTMTGDLTIDPPAVLGFGNTTRQMLNLYGTTYGAGVQGSTLYLRTPSDFAVYQGGVHDDGRGAPGAGGSRVLYYPNDDTFRIYKQLRTGGYGGGSGVQPLLLTSSGTSCYIGFYDGASPDAPGTRVGYMGRVSGHFWIMPEQSQLLILGAAGAEQGRIASGTFMFGKTASGLNVNGVQLFNTGPAYFTVGHNTATGVIYAHRQGSAIATTRAYLYCVEDGSIVGSITRAGPGTTAFNTTSDRSLKGNIEDINDDEALARVERWRPVTFQWRDRPNGAPSGDRHSGFIAQEMYEVNPDAVTPGIGTPEDREDWLAKSEAYERARAEHEAIRAERERLEAEHNAAMQQWAEDCERLAADWQATTERRTESGLVVVSESDGPELPEPPTPPELPELPELPEDPGPPTYTPWAGDWSKLVPDLTAAVQALIRENRALAERVAQLEAAR